VLAVAAVHLLLARMEQGLLAVMVERVLQTASLVHLLLTLAVAVAAH
jgi:hypothetical protein